jgi:hypothetical protein
MTAIAVRRSKIRRRVAPARAEARGFEDLDRELRARDP